MKYVLGFVFDNSMDALYLIKKNRPAWQSGYYNGLGGKIEDGESQLEAMRRECREECYYDTHAWVCIGYIETDLDYIAVFYTVLPKGTSIFCNTYKQETLPVENDKEGEIYKCNLSDIHHKNRELIPRVPILVQACLVDYYTAGAFGSINIKETIG